MSNTVSISAALALAFAVSGVPHGGQRARADEPITVGTVTVVVLAVGGAVGLGTALYRWFTDGEEGETIRVKITYDAEGNEISREVIKSTRSPAVVSLPADVPDMASLPGFQFSEQTTLDDRADDSLVLRAEGADYHANVLDTPGRYVAFEAERAVATSFAKPPGATDPPGSRSEASVEVSIEGLRIETTDAPGTDGSAFFELRVESPQLGTLFAGGARVRQGGSLAYTGDIPRAAYTGGPGRARLDFSDTVNVRIPDGLDRVDFEVRLVNGGDGVRRAPPPAPPAPPGGGGGLVWVALVLAIAALLLALLALRRRGATSP